MSITEIISLFASIASLILAVLAIWLSIVFFRLTSDLSEKAAEAAKGIGSSVERLEKLFDKLYADTFSMMRDTVSDIRRHIWPEDTSGRDQLVEEAERSADAKIEELRLKVSRELERVFAQQRQADEKLDGVEEEVSQLIDRVISSSREVEVQAREAALRNAIELTIRTLNEKEPFVSAGDLVRELRPGFSTSRIIGELTRMRDDGLIWTSDDSIEPGTQIMPRADGRYSRLGPRPLNKQTRSTGGQ